jgi:hypothetical protein
MKNIERIIQLIRFPVQLVVIFLSSFYFIGCYGKADDINAMHQTPIEDIDGVSDNPVMLINARSLSNSEVELIFSKELEYDSAALTSNYTIPDLTIHLAIPSMVTPETVVLTTEGQQSKTYTITVEHVLDSDGLVIDEDHNQAEFQGYGQETDNTCPYLLHATAVHRNLVQLEFSEPLVSTSINSASQFSIPGLTVSHAYLDSNPIRIFLETNNQSSTTYTVFVTDVTDYYDNLICEDKASLDFMGSTVQDMQPPYLKTVSAIDPTTVKLVFSESIDKTFAHDSTNYSIPELTILSAALVDDRGTVVYLSTSTQAEQSYLLTVTGVKDLQGNPIGDRNTGIFTGISGGTPVPPEFISAQALSNTTVGLYFSKPLTSGTAENSSNYSLPGLSISSATLSGSNPNLVILTTVSQQDQLYTVTISNLVGINGETVGAPVSQSFTGDALPCLVSVSPPTKTTLELVFSEALDATTALEISNYTETIAGLGITDVSLNANEIVLTTTLQVAGFGYTLHISNIEDMTGNTVDSGDASCTEKSFTGSMTGDVTPPTIDSITVDSHTQLTIVFSEVVEQASAEDESNYSLSPALSISNASRHTINKNTVILTTASMSAVLYTLTVDGVRDNALNTMVNETDDFTGDAYPCINSVNVIDNETILVTYSEPVDLLSAENTTNYTIPGLSISSAIRDPGNTDEVTLTTTPQIGGTIYTVTVTNVLDLTGNAIQAPGNTGNFIGIADTTPPEVISATALDDESVEVIFSEPLDQTTAEQASNYTIAGLPILSATLQVDPTHVVITTHYQSNLLYALVVASVEDGSGNIIQPPNDNASFTGLGSAPSYQNDFEGFSSITDLTSNGWMIVDDTQATSEAPSNWQVIGGDIRQSSNIWGGTNFPRSIPYRPGTYLVYAVNIGTDYFIQANMYSTDNDELGLLVRFTDETHYYRFSWIDEGAERRLVLTNGAGQANATALFVESLGYTAGQSYRMRFSVVGDTLEVFVDDRLVVSIIDNTLNTGYVGFYTWAMNSAYFEDVLIQSIP